jgi:hypothetical protein
MNAVVTPQQGQVLEAGQMTAEAPARLTTPHSDGHPGDLVFTMA